MGSLRDCNEKFTLAATILYEYSYDIYTRTIYMVHYKGYSTVGQSGTVQYLFSYGYSFPGITYFACILNTVALYSFVQVCDPINT